MKIHLTTKIAIFFFGAFLVAGPAFAAGPTYDIPVVITSPSPQAIFTFQPGDKVRVEARLTTNDIQEDPENEPLVLQVDVPYQSGIASNYVQLYIFDFKGSDLGSASMLSGWINNGDFDEQAELTVHVNPVDPVNKDPVLVQQLLTNSRLLSDAGDRYALAAKACRNLSPFKVDCAYLEAVASLYHGVSRLYEAIARDPIDPNYTVIATPVIPSFPTVATPPGVSQAEADAWNALFDNMKQTIGVGNVLITSINRAAGAMVAGDMTWKDQQVQAALGYAAQLALLVGAQADLHKNLQQILVQEGSTPIPLTVNDVINYQWSVYASGLPAFLVQDLTQLGLSAQDIDLIRQWTTVKDPNIVAAAGGFPDSLTYPPLITGLQKLQPLLVSFVAGDTIPPTTVFAASPLANAAGWNNTNVTVTLTASDNPGGSGVQQIRYSLSGAQTSGPQVVAGGTASVTISAEGTTTLIYFATDNAGNQETPKTLVVNIDKTPPAISGLPAQGCNLWPPDHRLVQVATISASDALSGLASFDVNTTSNEPLDPNAPDIVVTGSGLQPRAVQLRAWRLGQGQGRIYTINATASDMAGNTAVVTASCIVPHDQGQ